FCIRLFIIHFFFSSRRRHTRSKRDWSSDVCSSDLLIEGGFMDSRIDITAMRRNDMLAAQGRAVAEGVVQYYGLKKGSGGTVSTPAPSKPSKPSRKPSSGKISGSTYKVKRSEEHTSELQSRFDLVCRL